MMKLYFKSFMESLMMPMKRGQIQEETPPVICKKEKNVVSKPWGMYYARMLLVNGWMAPIARPYIANIT